MAIAIVYDFAKRDGLTANDIDLLMSALRVAAGVWSQGGPDEEAFVLYNKLGAVVRERAALS